MVNKSPRTLDFTDIAETSAWRSSAIRQCCCAQTSTRALSRGRANIQAVRRVLAKSISWPWPSSRVRWRKKSEQVAEEPGSNETAIVDDLCGFLIRRNTAVQRLGQCGDCLRPSSS